MIDAATVCEIIATYEKHGWILRRVLLSDGSRNKLEGSCSDLFGQSPVAKSSIDAAWFSRPPKQGEVAWEIRHLGETPYALVEHVDENGPDLEVILSTVESRMAETVSLNKSA